MLFSTVIYLELFIALFFLPGFFITVILGIKKFRFLLSFALSYALLVLTLLPFEYYAQPISRWSAWIWWEWISLAVLAVAKTFTYRNHGPGWKPLPRYIRGFFTLRLIVPLALAGVICVYLAYVGPYLEIPSDAWNHVAWFQRQASQVINQGAFMEGLSLKSFLMSRGPYNYSPPWYFIHDWLCNISSLAIMDSLHVLAFVNVLIFLLAIYYFGLFLFAGLRISTFRKMMMAGFAAVFAAATMGNTVFAFIRYYAFAPAILNYVLLLAAMAVIIDWLRSDRWLGCAHHGWLGHALWIAPVLLMATNAIHAQEALFILFMTLALGLRETVKTFWRKFFRRVRHSRNQCVLRACHSRFNATLRSKPLLRSTSRESRIRINDPPDSRFRGNDIAEEIHGSRCSVSERKNLIVAGILLLAFIAGFAAIRHFKPGSWISPQTILPNVGVPTEPVNFIFRNLIVHVPENPYLRLAVYQLFVFYQVVGCWGLFVYLLFGLMIRRFAKQPYLIAGMVIVPFLTVFNPLTVDLIVRMSQGAALYRFIYLIPLPFVGGYLFVHFWGKAREWFHRMRTTPAKSVSSIWPRLSWLNFVGSILVLAGLVGLIFPINAAGIYAPYSKIYTLRKIPAGNDYHLCDDLGKIMAKYEGKVILTDGWTSGYLAFYSPKNTYAYVKWLNSLNPEKEPPEPYTWEKLRNHGLIVINCRNGGLSITGKIAQHWPEDVLPKVSRYYSLEAQYHLESHPEKFRKIWSRDRIAVYAVR